MTHIEYFKLQAKNLFRDYKTKTPYIDDKDGNTYFEYSPKYFDIDEIFLAYDGILTENNWNEENLGLMKLQHIFAIMLGFKKWADISKASEVELELAKLLFDNQDKIFLEEWEMMYGAYDTESQLEIFNKYILTAEERENPFPDYRLNARSGGKINGPKISLSRSF